MKAKELRKSISRHGNTQPVPDETWREWRVKYQHGDITALSEKFGADREVFARALNDRKAQPLVIKWINTYYGLNAA